MGEAAPEQDALGQILYPGQDAGTGGGKAGHRLKQGIHRVGAVSYTHLKVIQTDRVFRAERPQKGRLREFVQCDIDILGDSSPNAEVELIDVTLSLIHI